MNHNYLTVGALTKYIKYQFENDNNLQEVYLKGEISNFKKHARGHFYFTIKDETSRISAIMFAGYASKLNFDLVDGMKILVHGKISVFESTGNYQIYVDELLEDGLGNLYLAFEQLKEKLSKEGLFDESHKKSIPYIPKKIGIITADTGAAIRDILSTIKRRFPICETILFPSLVQGKDAAKDIVKNIEIASEYNLDLLIVGRGGGSIEDLWPFNEEVVARAIYTCNIPIISAVGHEIDFTIADFVADKRAATPTAAAELAVPDLSELLSKIDSYKSNATLNIKNLIKNYNVVLERLKKSNVLIDPLNVYRVKEQILDNLYDKLVNLTDYKFEKYHLKIDSYIDRLNVLNPLNALKRGYTFVKLNNKTINSVNELEISDKIDILFNDGVVKAVVEKIKENV